MDLGLTYKNVPGGTAHWTFTGNGNYNNQSGDVAIVITKANASCVITPYNVPYDSNPHTATGSCTGVIGENLLGLNLSGTTHTNVGSYTNDLWTFSDEAGNYNNTSGTVLDAITKLHITVTADAKTKVVGQPDPVLTFEITFGSLYFGDTFTGMLTREPGEAVGTYAILQGSLSLPEYYDLTYAGADFTIVNATIFLPLVRH